LQRGREVTRTDSIGGRWFSSEKLEGTIQGRVQSTAHVALGRIPPLLAGGCTSRGSRSVRKTPLGWVRCKPRSPGLSCVLVLPVPPTSWRGNSRRSMVPGLEILKLFLEEGEVRRLTNQKHESLGTPRKKKLKMRKARGGRESVTISNGLLGQPQGVQEVELKSRVRC